MTYILAIDQGTSSTKTILFDEEGQPFAKAAVPLKTDYLEDGFVEQNPAAIMENVYQSVEKCLEAFKARGGVLKQIRACGISNQRETFLLWDQAGKPLCNAVVWQCKRSVQLCRRWQEEGYEPMIQLATGLRIDPYFSGSKLVWLYENDEKVRTAIQSGKAYFGTIDTWLLYKLTNGKSYYTDFTNASRTLLFNLHTLDWDKDLLAAFGLSRLNLPGPKASAAFFGETDCNGLLDEPVPVSSMIGDSHAAAFGEGCFVPGTAKATLGTGCSILMNIGTQPRQSKNGMVTTICWSTEQQVQYALEGVIVSCGATIEWLKNELGLFTSSKETEAMATAVTDNGGVYLVPAFSGLGAPYWDMKRKASIAGLNFGTRKNHVVRAALESIPYQIKDVMEAMERDTAMQLQQLMVDGGITSNGFILRFLADLLEKPVVHIGIPEVSALGAAYLAGLQQKIYKDIAELSQLHTAKQVLQPSGDGNVKTWYKGWQDLLGQPQDNR